MTEPFYEQQLTHIRKKCYSHISVYERISEARNFMHAFYDRSINLDQMAAKAYLSKYHFAREFKNAYGRTPHQYLTDIRLEKAILLLHQSSMSVADICIRVGFTSVSTFTGLFKKHMGHSPMAYRNKKQHDMAPYAGAFLKYPNGRFPGL